MKLFVSDMDGTLLGTDSRVSAASASILSDLGRRGALFTVATARTPATVQPLMDGIYSTVPAIVMTGAAFWDRQTQEYSRVAFMPASEQAYILELFRSLGVSPFVYALSPTTHLEVYHEASTLNRTEREFVRQRDHLTLKTFHLHEAPPSWSAGRTILIFAMGPLESLETIATRLRERGGCSVSCYPDIFDNTLGYLEIFAPEVSKARALMELKKSTGADELIVFGDNLNDLPMFEIADVAVAVGNALPQVREAADIVIGPNSEDSVAHFIRNNLE